MTETSPLGTHRPPAGRRSAPRRSGRTASPRAASRPASRRGWPAPDGELLPWDGESAGELEVRGPWIAGAYYGGADGEPLRPEDKFSADGWLRTGDVGMISPDGYPDAHRPRQGRHQVRRRVDLLASSWRTR